MEPKTTGHEMMQVPTSKATTIKQATKRRDSYILIGFRSIRIPQIMNYGASCYFAPCYHENARFSDQELAGVGVTVGTTAVQLAEASTLAAATQPSSPL